MPQVRSFYMGFNTSSTRRSISMPGRTMTMRHGWCSSYRHRSGAAAPSLLAYLRAANA